MAILTTFGGAYIKRKTYPYVAVWDLDVDSPYKIKLHIAVSKNPQKTGTGEDKQFTVNTGTSYDNYKKFFHENYSELIFFNDEIQIKEMNLKRGGKIEYKGSISSIVKEGSKELIEEKTVTLDVGSKRLYNSLVIGNSISRTDYLKEDIPRMYSRLNKINLDRLDTGDYQGYILPIMDIIRTLVGGVIEREFRLNKEKREKVNIKMDDFKAQYVEMKDKNKLTKEEYEIIKKLWKVKRDNASTQNWQRNNIILKNNGKYTLSKINSNGGYNTDTDYKYITLIDNLPKKQIESIISKGFINKIREFENKYCGEVEEYRLDRVKLPKK